MVRRGSHYTFIRLVMMSEDYLKGGIEAWKSAEQEPEKN
jgi:hypothetical protein